MIRIDMDIPQNCAECRFADSDYGYCSAMPKEFCGYTEDNRKPEWCPLSEIVTVGAITKTIDGTKTDIYSDVHGE